MRRGKPRIAAVLISLLLTLVASTVQAQVSGLTWQLDPDPDRDHVLRVLTYTGLTLRFDETPAREAFAHIASALNIPFLARYSDDPAGHGIDPQMPLTLNADNMRVLEALEALLEQCEVYEDCTWQIRTGMVEIGTKRQLASESARVTRLYDFNDLALEAGYNRSALDAGMQCYKTDSPYVQAAIGEKERKALYEGNPPPSKDRQDRIVELVETIIETIEPGQWDLGGKSDDDDQFWASIRVVRGQLVVKAPDFIQRQIVGDMAPPAPRIANDDGEDAGVATGKPSMSTEPENASPGKPD